MKMNAVLISVLAVLLLTIAFSLQGCAPKEEIPPSDELIGGLPLFNETIPIIKPSDEVPSKTAEHNVSLKIYGVEGDLIDLNPLAEDPDGDSISISFSEPFSEKGLWQTKEGDAGEYIVIVSASDGKDTTETRVLVSIAPGNKAPAVECPDEIIVNEGDTINLDCNIYDLEGDSVIVAYSGFLRSPIKKTGFDDAGEYTAVVQASDKEKTTTKKITVIVENKNRPPVVEPIADITAVEDDVIIVEPEVSDPDGDDIDVEFSDPLGKNSGIWNTEDGDDGVYDAYVKVSDGDSTAIQRFKITVYNKNTAPVLKNINDIVVYEGELVKLPIDAYDPEGDKLILSYSGWMDSQERQTTYDDAGNYTVQVTVSDGVLSASQVVGITVLDKNRPPVFIRP
ncbi:MAG: hypothetical protein V1659_00965, partial [Candidatus Woesearchaeota archaeon]